MIEEPEKTSNVTSSGVRSGWKMVGFSLFAMSHFVKCKAELRASGARSVAIRGRETCLLP